jgi:hypothetical protein
MWKAVLAGTAALAIVGSSIVYAQQRPPRGDRSKGGPNIEDMRAYGDARLAALKAGLALTAEQERLWPAFEAAARDMQKLRLDRINERISARREGGRPNVDPVERMRRSGTAMADTGTALKKLADATEPLYKTLSDSQKRRFVVLSRLGGQHGRGQRFRGNEDRPRGGDRGPRRTDFEGFEGNTPQHGFVRPAGEERL